MYWLWEDLKEMAGGQAIFEWKCTFFSTSFWIIVKVGDQMMQSNYLCVILHVVHKKILVLTVLTWFIILDEIQDGSQNGHHVWWHHRPSAAPPPIKYTSSRREDQRLFTEGKIVSKYCNISKTLGGNSFNSPPCTTVGFDFACTSEG